MLVMVDKRGDIISQTLMGVLGRKDASKLQLGQLYEVKFKPVFECSIKAMEILLEVSSIERVQDFFSRSLTFGLYSLPEPIKNVFINHSTYPLSFILTLAYQIGGQVTPQRYALKLKLGILLSLASTGRDAKLHILATGTDTKVLQRYVSNDMLKL